MYDNGEFAVTMSQMEMSKWGVMKAEAMNIVYGGGQSSKEAAAPVSDESEDELPVLTDAQMEAKKKRQLKKNVKRREKRAAKASSAAAE